MIFNDKSLEEVPIFGPQLPRLYNYLTTRYLSVKDGSYWLVSLKYIFSPLIGLLELGYSFYSDLLIERGLYNKNGASWAV